MTFGEAPHYAILFRASRYFSSGPNSAGLRTGWLGVRFPAGAGNFYLHRVKTGSGAHSASYPMGTRGPFPGG